MFAFFLCIIITFSRLVSGYFVVLSGDSNIIQGETAHFRAKVFDENGILSTSEYTFEFSDNGNPKNFGTVFSKSPALWNVTYDSKFLPEEYTAFVKVKKNILLLKTTVGTASFKFNLTEYLKGNIQLKQGNFTRKKYVSNIMPVNHKISLEKSHLDFLYHTKNSTLNKINTFWFVDCIYYGIQSGFEFDFNYTKVDSKHLVEALLVASFKNNSSIKNNILLNKKIFNKTIVHDTMNKDKSNNSKSSATSVQVSEDEILIHWLINFNKSYANISKPVDYCINSSVVPLSKNNIYGFFRTNLTVKSPVKISPINGTNWLKDGEILNINVSCNGSSPYSFCVLLKSGLYNVTGNEICNEEQMIRNCSFGIQHLFKKPAEYTLVVIISNAVSRVVKPIAVNIYKVKKHAQLSVIIVPVSFSLIATILIIFGVAYYVQSKHKYTIEVADFDFGNQTSNLEYRTFGERLRESISNSFLKSNDYLDGDSGDSGWSEPVSSSRKYGSMQ